MIESEWKFESCHKLGKVLSFSKPMQLLKVQTDLKQKLSSSLTSSQADIDIAEEDRDKLSNLQIFKMFFYSDYADIKPSDLIVRKHIS